MSKWQEYRLREVAEVQTGPFGSQLHQSDYKVVGTPIITVEHLGDNRIVHSNLPLVGELDRERLIKYTLKEGDVVFSRVGSVDRCAYVHKEEDGWMFSGRLLRVRVRENTADSRFLSFYFSQESFKDTIRMIAVGATMPSINTEIFSNVEMVLPPLPEQRAIAGVLSSLDDKIDLLHRQNKTLEGMAEALWRKMFVEEADPRWKKGMLGDYGQIICGKTPSKKVAEYFGGHIPFIKIPDMHGNVFIFETEDSLTEAGKNFQANKTIPAKSICVSCIATVGLVGMNAFDSQTNQQINTIIPNKEFQRYFLFLLMRNMTDDLFARASGGTATDNLNTGDFSRIEISIPAKNIIQKFDDLVKDYFEKIYKSQIQIYTLSHLRDVLLPKFISGEVKVKL